MTTLSTSSNEDSLLANYLKFNEDEGTLAGYLY